MLHLPSSLACADACVIFNNTNKMAYLVTKIIFFHLFSQFFSNTTVSPSSTLAYLTFRPLFSFPLKKYKFWDYAFVFFWFLSVTLLKRYCYFYRLYHSKRRSKKHDGGEWIPLYKGSIVLCSQLPHWVFFLTCCQLRGWIWNENKLNKNNKLCFVSSRSLE